ncbi:MAG: hypothetical protein PVH00_05845 [Gemmatimonadota bacterium]
MGNAPNSRRWTQSRARPGSALTAVILVIVVAALLATVAWPTTARSSNRADAERLVATVQADMEEAFAHAGMQGRPVSIQFDPTHLHYDIRDRETGELLAERRFTGTPTHPLRSMWVSHGRVTVDGTGEASTHYWIHFRWGDGDDRWLTVQRSGRIRELDWR